MSYMIELLWIVDYERRNGYGRCEFAEIRGTFHSAYL